MMNPFRARLSTRFHFEAAHFMPSYPVGHPNRAIHGHSFTGEVVVESFVNPQDGMVMDHDVLHKAVNEVVKVLDHCMLNEVPGLEQPTGECIARWIWMKLKPSVRGLKEVIVSRESVGIRASYSDDFQDGLT
jgi:6-pyruvoyltetrahydropterin/6-carboxytetrahydropterin synthase